MQAVRKAPKAAGINALDIVDKGNRGSVSTRMASEKRRQARLESWQEAAEHDHAEKRKPPEGYSRKQVTEGRRVEHQQQQRIHDTRVTATEKGTTSKALGVPVLAAKRRQCSDKVQDAQVAMQRKTAHVPGTWRT